MKEHKKMWSSSRRATKCHLGRHLRHGRRVGTDTLKVEIADGVKVKIARGTSERS